MAELDAWIGRSGGFFASKPVVIDLTRLPISRPDLAGLLAQLQARQIRIVAVEGADPAWLGGSLAPLPCGAPPSDIEAPGNDPRDPAAGGEVTGAPEIRSLLLEQPVRSGQSVFFPEGDVTVLGSVASGAEVIAGGSIHVYGTLRGRAVAGADGNRQARIFCRKFEAELLVIGGLYRTADDAEPGFCGRPVQAWLEGEVMMMAALD